jgi:GNAT superfamily N-acetyltransferase
MSVKKEYRRKGIGKLILNYLIKKAKKIKIKKLILETEHNWDEVVQFYKNLGFVEYKRDNIDVFMAIDLSKIN